MAGRPVVATVAVTPEDADGSEVLNFVRAESTGAREEHMDLVRAREAVQLKRQKVVKEEARVTAERPSRIALNQAQLELREAEAGELALQISVRSGGSSDEDALI